MAVIDISADLPIHKRRTPSTRDWNKLDTIVVHTTNSVATIEALAKYHVSPYLMYKGERVWNHITKLGCPTFCYHDVIKTTGNIFHCVDYDKITFHAGNYNKRSLAVALNYVAEDGDENFVPAETMMKSLYKHVSSLCLKHGVLPTKVLGHREVPDSGWFWYKGSKKYRKSCPGWEINLIDMRRNITKALQLTLKANRLYLDGLVDGVFGPLTWDAFLSFRAK